MATVSAQKMGDDKVRAATGRIWAEWYALLDAENATTWKHPQIARWLAETHDVDGWWAQAVTVGYEQERGLRQPGQRADGTFAVTATKTLAVIRADALDAVLAALVKHFGEPASLNPASHHSTARWSIDGNTIIVGLSEVMPGKTLVALERSKMVGAESLAPAKTELQEVLNSVANAAL